jgi:hypothetical protein
VFVNMPAKPVPTIGVLAPSLRRPTPGSVGVALAADAIPSRTNKGRYLYNLIGVSSSSHGRLGSPFGSLFKIDNPGRCFRNAKKHCSLGALKSRQIHDSFDKSRFLHRTGFIGGFPRRNIECVNKTSCVTTSPIRLSKTNLPANRLPLLLSKLFPHIAQ